MLTNWIAVNKFRKINYFSEDKIKQKKKRETIVVVVFLNCFYILATDVYKRQILAFPVIASSTNFSLDQILLNSYPLKLSVKVIDLTYNPSVGCCHDLVLSLGLSVSGNFYNSLLSYSLLNTLSISVLFFNLFVTSDIIVQVYANVLLFCSVPLCVSLFCLISVHYSKHTLIILTFLFNHKAVCNVQTFFIFYFFMR